ncbi:Putative proximal rod protein [Legionella massiliensis]|uniref:Flagellar basal-body rod protein FlgC n=1 Tax=Legionella massiliensis TaxID=1034943 RepID=A0A078KZA2_9GAMM|nr:flagellar basal body rod protein FlgC [Legionella massiliensis]CDZ77063.1 Putative proximal rod protein [Legionella massiliensis]CEE12801.1 Flagellar basal-body rod protein FlgC [Legionella massiliensis]
MSYDQIYTIAREALSLEKLRIDLVANNIANQHSLQNADGSQFQPMQVVATAKPFSTYLSEPEQSAFASVQILPENVAPNKTYQPGHPAADQQGYVSYPGLSMVDEMTTLLRASRAYEANVKVINTAHNLYLQALSIGDER